MVYLIVKLNQALNNDDFAEFYETSFGIFAPEIIHVFTEIKALESADILNSTLPVVYTAGLLDEAYIELVFKIKPLEQQRE